jgi:Domain of unknown function (DUF4386)
MTHSFPESSPSARGRVLAALYLFVVIAGITAQSFISDRLVVGDDAGSTAANILANKSLYRLGFTIFMLEMVAQIGVVALFYDLLRPVNPSIARVAAVIGFTGCGIKTLARLFYYAPLILLGGPSYLAAIEPAQLEALSLAFIRINSQAAAIALIFFGFQSLLQGWLVFNSGFLPRFLGVISMVGGLGWLTFLWPPLGYQAFMGVALVALVGVIATVGWLFIRGVDDVKWRARAALAANSIWR